MFIASVVTAVVVAWKSHQRRHSPAMVCVWLTSAGIAQWSVCEVVVLLQPGFRVEAIAKSALYLGVSAVVVGYYLLTHAVVDRSWRITWPMVAVLLIEPVLTMLAVTTNNLHHLFIAEWIHPGPSDMVPILEVWGPLFWAHSAYSYLVLLVGSARVVRALRRAPRALWGMYSTILTGAITPAVANFLSITHLVEGNITALGFTVAVALSYHTLKREWLLERIPVGAQRIVDTLNDAVLVIDQHGRVVTTNPAAESLAERLCPDCRNGLTAQPITTLFGDVALMSAQGCGVTRHTLTDFRHSGLDLQVRVSAVHDRRERLVGWMIVAHDITELNARRRQAERATAELRDKLHTIDALRADLAELAVRDPLTGLYNRRYLMDRLTELGAAARSGPVSLAIIDLDHFKRINDDNGHDAGDRVLTDVAHALAAEVGPGDVAARHGGEEFILLMADADADQAWRRVDGLRVRIAATPTTVGEDDGRARDLSVTFSAGVATAVGGFSPKAMLRAADTALYLAKRTGRNRVHTAGDADELPVAHPRQRRRTTRL